MAWAFAFEAPVGTRIKKRYFGVTNYEDLWYCDELRVWVTLDELPEEYGASTHARCNSVKAFKRHLRKHPELRKLNEVLLTSIYEGHDVIARWYDND